LPFFAGERFVGEAFFGEGGFVDLGADERGDGGAGRGEVDDCFLLSLARVSSAS